jgi:hypothetical protein
MKNIVDSNSEKRKKPYEPPVYRRVRLEVRTSVLAVCSISTNVSPNPVTCLQDEFTPCFDLTY